MDETDGRLLRYVFATEVALLALPTIGVLAQFVAALAFIAYGGLLFTVYGLVTFSEDASLSHLVFTGLLSALVTAAFVALWHFMSLSVDYIAGRNVRTPKHRRKFWIGLSLAIIPMLLPIAASIRELYTQDSDPLWLFYFSGLPMLVPVLHLAVATSLDD